MRDVRTAYHRMFDRSPGRECTATYGLIGSRKGAAKSSCPASSDTDRWAMDPVRKKAAPPLLGSRSSFPPPCGTFSPMSAKAKANVEHAI